MSNEKSSGVGGEAAEMDEPQPDMSLVDITDGENERKIPRVKFPEDVEAFANSFSPPASAELLIGAYTELHNKFKSFEANLEQKSKPKFPATSKRLVWSPNPVLTTFCSFI